MFDTRLSRVGAFVAIMFVTALVGAIARKGRRVAAAWGAFIGSNGAVMLAAHKVWQKGGAAPIEGSFADFIGLLFLGWGGYMMCVAFFGKSADRHAPDRSQQT